MESNHRGIMRFLHSSADLSRKRTEERLRKDESAAGIRNSDSEIEVRLRQMENERLRIDLEFDRFEEETSQRRFALCVQAEMIRHGLNTGADVEFKDARVTYKSVPQSIPSPQEQPFTLPQAPSFSTIANQIKQGKMILGFNNGGCCLRRCR